MTQQSENGKTTSTTEGSQAESYSGAGSSQEESLDGFKQILQKMADRRKRNFKFFRISIYDLLRNLKTINAEPNEIKANLFDLAMNRY